MVDLGRRAAPFFAELRKFLAPRIHCIYYSRRGVVRSVLRASGADLFPITLKLSGARVAATEVPREWIGEKALLTEPESVLSQAPALLAELANFLDDQKVDALLVWNGSGLIASLAVHLARARGLRVIFGENGYLPGTLQLDSEGVNQYASITRRVATGEASLPPEAVLDEELDRALAAYREGRVPESQPMPRHLRPNRAAKVRREMGRILDFANWKFAAKLDERNFPIKIDKLPDRFVLLPFQVSQDSQLILHSPLVGGDMRRLLDVVHRAVIQVDPELELVVKLHPAENSRMLGSYRDLPRAYPRVRFTLWHPLQDLLAKCAVVVTINSTVGFEGLLFSKPVIALGRNFYVAPGLAEPVLRLDDLSARLRRSLEDPPDAERLRSFLRYVYGKFLTRASYRDFGVASFRAAADRIVELTRMSA